MKTNRSWRVRLAQISLGVAIVFAFFVTRGIRAGNDPVHLTTDWSHRHLIFSTPKDLMQQFRLSGNVRYVQQWVRRNAEIRDEREDFRWRHAPEPDATPLHGDWNVYMGNVGTAGANTFPAKFSFNEGTANCGTAAQPDFVVYNTSLAGSATAVAAFDTATFSAEATTGSTVTITTGSGSTLVMTAGTTNAHTATVGSASTGTYNRNQGGTANATSSAAGLAAGIVVALNGSNVGVTATSTGAVVTITATTAGTTANSTTVAESTTPASNLTTTFANLVDGASGVPTIVAFDNLYSGCSGTVPSNYWAYNTGTGDSVVTSPVLSGDGKQVAFMQSVGAGAASLVLLRWASGSTVAAPATPTSDTPTNYFNGGTGCTAPCMTTIAFADADADTTSSPFYDYAPGSDTLYVGDASGRLHKFNPVFKGVPAEVTTQYPFLMATAPLSSPVYDEGSGLVFASAAFQTSNNGGRLHSLCATGTSCGTTGVTTVASGLLGPSTVGATCQSPGAGGTSGDAANLFFDTPVVDPANAVIYLIIGNDSTGSSGLYEFPEKYTAGSCGTEIKVGTGSTANPAVPAYSGNFDNAYYSGGAGHFYVCANTGGAPTLYQITVSAAGIPSGTANASAALTTATTATACGPVTEVFNANAGPATDWIFTSVEGLGQTASPISCPTNTGCIMSFNVTAPFTLTTSTVTSGKAAVAGGASGIIFDNTVESSPTGASQVYFTPLATGNCTTTGGQGIGGCAIQASQSLLQ